MASTATIAAESVAPPPAGFSDLAYQAGVVGQEFRERLAAGTGTYADAQPSSGRGASGGQAASAARGTPPAGRGAAPSSEGAGRGGAAAGAPSGRAGGGRGESGLTVQ